MTVTYFVQDENEIGRSEVGFEKKGLEFESEKRVGITPVKEEVITQVQVEEV